ncbi:ShlB/FhaC/HecB family hemolysin secretion/activation protein [Rhodocyclus tenuis]|uniref:Hemolysin activation/secretion protein n=1 Tax=Rhodocyclus tenuis TaxID=1066 RepID=A0A840GCF0_RHOTE|nr:ShlB/FhaC/HecB family hemolysin secretion/activation protein [Rhodocyclus tenuis]MBB4248328.1 hemolysin activation/secretion protein [Rhodocyclus tenuis]
MIDPYRFSVLSATLALLLALPAVHAADLPPASTEAPRFDVFEYVVDGNSVLSPPAIERAVYPFLGPQLSLREVEQARAALEKAYQDEGYLTVSVELPEQRVNAGEIRLRVVEGSVEKLRVSGAQYHLPSRIREGVPSLAQGNVPQFDEVQSELAALGRQPDRRVTPLLRPGKAPGKLEVELKVDDGLPLHASLEANNKQSVNTVEGRAEAALRYDNLFQRGHSLGLNWIVAPRNTDHADIVTANYGVPFASGDYAYAFITHSNSNTPSGIGGSTVVKGTSFGARYRLALPTRGGAFAHGLSVGADLKDNKDDMTQSGLVVPRSLRYGTFSARYDLTQFDSGDGISNSFDATMTLGARALGEHRVDCDGFEADQFACKRYNARPNFMSWRFGAEHRRPLFGDWNLRVRGDAQVANGPLVSQEQFGIGGSDSVRGYYEYEQFGDNGALLRLELGSPVVAWLGSVGIKGLGFAERGQVWLIDSLPGEKSSVGMGSFGIGLRAESKQLSGRIEWALPQMATKNTERNDGRVFLSLKLQF